MKSNNLSPILFQYLQFKEELAQIEEGRWQQNKKLANMSIDNVETYTENMRTFIRECERMNLHKLVNKIVN